VAPPQALSEHAFDKLRLLDCTFAELGVAIPTAEIIEDRELDSGELKELLLLIAWKRPLHVVVIVDDLRREERLVTVYEPDRGMWTPDYRRRR
jgi:hypothetical protein